MTQTASERLRTTAAATRVRFTWWGVRKTLDDSEIVEVAGVLGTSALFLSASKRLINTRNDAYRRLTKKRGEITRFWKGLTLPYVEAGVRLLRQSDVVFFNGRMHELRDELLASASYFADMLESIKDEAQASLNGLYREEDYPKNVADLFTAVWEFPPTEPPSYLMTLSPEVYEAEKRRVAVQFEEAVRLAEREFAERFAELVASLTDMLRPTEDGRRKVVRAQSVESLREFFQRFRSVSVTDDATLNALVKQAESALEGRGADGLRYDAALRLSVRGAMEFIGQQLERHITTLPTRRLIRPTQKEKCHAAESV